MPQRRRAIDWPKIIEQIKAGESQQSVADKHGIARQTLQKRGMKEGWINREADLGEPEQNKWFAALRDTDMMRRLENPQTRTEMCIATQGNRTIETAARILTDVERGITIGLASLANGMPYETWKDWRKAEPELDRLYKKARHRLLGDVEATIPEAAMRGDWKAAESYLKSAHETRKDWAQSSSGHGGITVNITLRQDSSHPTVDITPETVTIAQTEDEE